MKKISFLLCIIMLCATGFATTKTKVSHRATTAKKQATETITLTSSAGVGSYHIALTNASHHYEFGFLANGGSVQETIASGTYLTVAIGPDAGEGTTHQFHGLTCTTPYSGSGNSISWRNVVITCPTTFTLNL